MLLAPALGAPPREIAERLGDALRDAARRRSSTASRSPGPGFLNLFLADAWYAARSARVLAAGEGFGGGGRRAGRSASTSSSSPPTRPARCTSATPATPPTATRSRGCSRFHGHDVDARVLRQRLRLAGRAASAQSIQARARGEELARGRLPGRLRRRARRADPGRRRRATLDELGRRGVELDARAIARDRCARFRRRVRRLVLASARCTDGDRARRSSARSTRSRRQGAPTAPRARCGCARPTFGDDKDRVLERSDGEHTYFASDIAYHAGQARARLRPADRRLGRRPPRLRRSA